MVELNLNNISLGYHQRLVVEGITLEAKAKEVLGFVGPNGCGKSTLIKAMSRVLTPHSGDILLNGEDIKRIPRMQLAKMLGVVPQIPLLPSNFTAFEAVLMGRNPHLGLFKYEGKNDMDIAWQAMEKAGIVPLAHRKIGELSGGEIQCVVIARVLAQQTQAILLDEPTANLDIGRQVDVLNLIRDLSHKDGLTIVIALHELNLAAQYCDRLVLIDKGIIVCSGKPPEVITAENISRVYGSGSYVGVHPLSGLPIVLPNACTNR